MFRIRRIFDDLSPGSRVLIEQVVDILERQFPGLNHDEYRKIPDMLSNPVKYQFRPILYVSEKKRYTVGAFALMLHDPSLGFCYLDYLSVSPGSGSRGIGGILYDNLRREARLLDVVGIFFECLPDDPALSPDPLIRKQNQARLRFYERFGAYPVAGTRYETPVKPGDTDPPYLMFDGLGRNRLPGRDNIRRIVKAILHRKYGDVCGPEYIRNVVDSFTDDPIRLRAPRYVKSAPPVTVWGIPESRLITLVVNERHTIHHVRERGYVEAPARIGSILKQLEPSGLFRKVKARPFSEKYILAVHERKYIDYFKAVCRRMQSLGPLYPYVFPVRNAARPPRELSVRAGYFCIDTFTPLSREAFTAARGAVDATLSGALSLLEGATLAYALVRPPGHHAERGVFGGFCYFNNNAIAADYLSRYGRVCILDIDFHHGNGQQDIFYRRRDVLTISLHGHPNFAYPYFSGFREERGEGDGVGFNINYPLPENINGEVYRSYLGRALTHIRRFRPLFLVVAFGTDTAKNDPTGSWLLSAADFKANGKLIGALKLKTLCVHEGGYDNRVLGSNVKNFFEGLFEG
ncbi:MAG TPA: histone deacetylase family protein, partial [Spirochaetia bacterium]|nr:histone deacetylase family protein [Spirochaetia bacterium]